MIDPELGRTECDSEKTPREARTDRAETATEKVAESKGTPSQKPREVVVLWGRCGFVPSELTHEEPSR